MIKSFLFLCALTKSSDSFALRGDLDPTFTTTRELRLIALERIKMRKKPKHLGTQSDID